jgi:hypothetical protein
MKVLSLQIVWLHLFPPNDRTSVISLPVEIPFVLILDKSDSCPAAGGGACCLAKSVSKRTLTPVSCNLAAPDLCTLDPVCAGLTRHQTQRHENASPSFLFVKLRTHTVRDLAALLKVNTLHISHRTEWFNQCTTLWTLHISL